MTLDARAQILQGSAMNELSLFTGYGGFTLGLRLAGLKTRTVCYVEIEPYCQKIIKARIRDGLLEDAPIWDDICTFKGRQFRGLVDILTAGFPCQPHSVAGKRKGAVDDRNLWPDTLRTIDEVGPAIVLLENVPGILANGYAGTVVGQLAERGYDCTWGLLSAITTGAPHVRTRWWCLAYANRFRAAQSGCRGDCLRGFLGEISQGRNQEDQKVQSAILDNGYFSEVSTNPAKYRLGIGQQARASDSFMAYRQNQHGEGSYTRESTEKTSQTPSGRFPSGSRQSWWDSEPRLDRMVTRNPHQVDRLTAIGNGIVPAVVAEFLRRVTP